MRRQGSRSIGAVFAQLVIGLGILGWSYRFPALLGLIIIVIWQAVGRPDPTLLRRRWIVWAIVIALGVLPVGVSLQMFAGKPHLTPAIPGLLTVHAFEDAEKGEVVIVGSWAAIYDEPTWFGSGSAGPFRSGSRMWCARRRR